MSHLRWSQAEDAILRENPVSAKMLVTLLPGRTDHGIKTRRRFLKLAKPMGPIRTWSLAEDHIVTQLYPDYRAMFAALPHRTESAIRTRTVRTLRLPTAQTVWLASELKVIRDDDGNSTAAELQLRLVRHTLVSIGNQRYRLGVRYRRIRRPDDDGLRGDIVAQAKRVGLSTRQIARRLSERHGFGGALPNHRLWNDAVALLGGELYAEWED